MSPLASSFCHTNLYSSLFTTVVVEKATITDKQEKKETVNKLN